MIDAVIAAALAYVTSRLPLGLSRGAPWLPDSFAYAVRMLMLRGVPFGEARERAHAFFRQTWIGRYAPYAPLLEREEPEWWRLFTPRVVYPALAAVLYPYRGFDALADVSRGAYVLNAVALYRWLRRYTAPVPAAGITLAFTANTQLRTAGGSSITDATAMLAWTLAADAGTGFVADGRGRGRVVVTTALLAFTRPIAYLPAGAGALGALVCALRGDAPRARRAAFVAVNGIVSSAAVAFVLQRARVPSTAQHFADVRAALAEANALYVQQPAKLDRLAARLGGWDAPGRSTARWYAGSVLLSTITVAYGIAREPLALAGIAGFVRARRKPEAAFALGAVLAGGIGILADPVARAAARTIVLPLLPVFALGCALLFAKRATR